MQLTKFFYTKNINKIKLKRIKQKAFQLCLYRNQISEYYYEHLKINQNLPNLFETIKIKTKQNVKYLVNKDQEYAIKQVNSNYLNKMSNIKKAKPFFIIEDIRYLYYKKDTKNNKKGDLKEIKISKKQSELSMYLNFMSKKLPENWFSYIQIVINNTENKDIKNFYIRLNNYLLSKPEWFVERIIKLAKNKNYRTFLKYWAKPIAYNSLSFKTQSRVKDEILNINKNKNSCITHFINLGAFEGKLSLPIKFHSKYHKAGQAELVEGNYVQTYNMKYDGENFDRIELSFEREYADLEIDLENIVGVDINSKHNIFYTSDNESLMLEKRYISKAIFFLKKQDKDKSKYIKKQVEKQRKVLKYEIDKLINCLLVGKTHIVLEDLKISNGKLRSKNAEHDIIYNRLINLLNLSDLKNRIRLSALKRGIMVSLVPPEYTSQKCNKCKKIDKGNRKNQEEFICTCCAYEDNADRNSANNIREIVVNSELRQLLLKFNGKYFEPLSLSRDKIKNIYHQM